jgi:hypothetical protein
LESSAELRLSVGLHGCRRDEASEAQLQEREADGAALWQPTEPSGASRTAPDFRGPPDPKLVEEAMKLLKSAGTGGGRRRARGLRAQCILLVALAALAIYTMVGLSGHGTEAELRGSEAILEISVTAVLTSEAQAELRLSVGLHGCRRDEASEAQLQEREADGAALCQPTEPSGASPSLSAGVRNQQA